MKKTLSVILAAAMLICCVMSFASCGNSSAKYTVGICQLVQHEALDAATKGFMDVLKEEFGDDVVFLNENASNDIPTCTTIVNNFVQKKVNLIMANATPALSAAVNATNSIPVLGTSITEYGTALGIKDFNGTVGGNVSGTSDLAPLDQQAAMIAELFPSAKSVAVLYCTSEANSAYQIKVIKEELTKKNITIVDCGFTDSNDVNSAAAKAANSDVIYIPTDNTAASCATAINGLIGNTPVIAGEEGICKKCGVATLSISYYDLGRATGEMAVKILKGEASISTMPVGYANAVKKYNATKCAELGINIDNLKALGYEAIAD